MIRALVMCFAAFLFVACGGPAEFLVVGTSRATGTDGTILVESTEGGNNLVTIELVHLPPPSRVEAGTTKYVVWFTEDGQAPVRMGALNYDEDARQGTMVATTTLKSFHVRVTAESTLDASAPSEVVIAEKMVSGSK